MKRTCTQKRKNSAQCNRCDLHRRSVSNSCPALRRICHKCKKVGYWDRVCKPNSVQRLEKDVRDAVFLGSISENASAGKCDFLINLEILDFAENAYSFIDIL